MDSLGHPRGIVGESLNFFPKKLFELPQHGDTSGGPRGDPESRGFSGALRLRAPYLQLVQATGLLGDRADHPGHPDHPGPHPGHPRAFSLLTKSLHAAKAQLRRPSGRRVVFGEGAGTEGVAQPTGRTGPDQLTEPVRATAQSS